MASSVAEHRHAVTHMLRALDALPAETVPLRDARGRLLAADLLSPLDLPLFRNSQMDGFAVDAGSVESTPVTLSIAGTVAAGDAGSTAHVAGTAVRIMTGAPIPDGADAIVPVEDTTVADDRVTIDRGRTVGEFVREAGSDVVAGELLVAAGTLLAARHIAVLAAVGVETVSVRRRPRAAVITTGAELVPAGQPLSPGQIYDSNGIALATSLEANGAEVVSVARSSDDVTQFRRLLDDALANADLVITSGGVSMGDFEVVKETLQPLGGQFGHVGMQPGGPQGLTMVNDVPVLSFPGNPVSTLVSFEVFARPLLRKAAGLPAVVAADLPITRDLTSVPNRRQFLRGRVRDGQVDIVSGPGSHLVAGMALADVLIDLSAETTTVSAGTHVQVWAL
ncbi:molybdopterin molybdotransferase MoeA [Antrihabitans cavernicola]|uniref:Molybdopterin molybdenumtransferase n=1 Tax=Antrihabitans cavernicola TaxID=2495913 RepID=A0A5A7SE37_9NOCA|nr:gephyrin-like molybdotransferase Glp [Spelaeibacter cavernicola]KAA0024126.1 molybdopterin molybdotransferase MoeA [Spelaeibacter cavernicola]